MKLTTLPHKSISFRMHIDKKTHFLQILAGSDKLIAQAPAQTSSCSRALWHGASSANSLGWHIGMPEKLDDLYIYNYVPYWKSHLWVCPILRYPNVEARNCRKVLDGWWCSTMFRSQTASRADIHMGMYQNLYCYIFVGWTSLNILLPAIFGVHSGTRVLTGFQL